ncbi:MAG: hypothetical protein KAS32_26870, partial [Candidatus Peribacteraceae bacterium]|nr:hypothetical protein [Candidatus Peribacteraceae bacterium]
MKKTFILSLLFILALAFPAFGADYTLCSSGCNATTMQGGFNLLTVAGDTLTITETDTYTGDVSTVAAGASGNTIKILVQNGITATFTGSFDIDHDYFEIHDIIIDTSTAGVSSGAIDVHGDNFTSDGMTIRNTASRAVQSFANVDGTTVRNCTIFNTEGPSFNYLSGNTNGLVEYCDLSYLRGEDAFRMYGNNHIIRNNEIHHVSEQNTYATSIQWLPSHVYDVTGYQVVPTSDSGYIYAVEVRGTSSGTEPVSWSTTLGDTFVDGTVTWRVGTTVHASENPHCDVLQMDTTLQGDYHTILVENNYIHDFWGQGFFLDCENWGEGGINCDNITWRNNLHVRHRGANQSYVPINVYNNVFYYMGLDANSRAVSLPFCTGGGCGFNGTRGNASGSNIVNNIFMYTGVDASTGMYTVHGSLTSVTTDYNLVYQDIHGNSATKSAFSETNGINGSDPLFTNDSMEYDAGEDYTLASTNSPAYD